MASRPLEALRVGLAACVTIAFLSLARDAPALFGPEGLAPAEAVFDALRARAGWARLPSLFAFLPPTDAALRGLATLGAAGGLLLAHPRLTRWLALPLAALYLSFANAGTVFYSFQWDSLLVEMLVTAALLGPSPGRGAVWAFRLLFLRLYVEGGLAKALWSDDWTSLRAMGDYWRTAPLPTPLAWWADRLPAAVQQGLTAGTLVVECLLPFALFVGPRSRRAVFGATAALQVGILATANYGTFNLLTLLLGLSLLAEPGPERSRAEDVGAALLLPLGFVVGLSRFLPGAPFADLAAPLQRWRVANAYHLFASIDPERYEVEVVGSDDGATWYRLPIAWKPPAKLAWVAPYHPRLAFRLWFSTLGGRGTPLGFETEADPFLARVAERWCHAPDVLDPLLDHPVRAPDRVSLVYAKNGFAPDHAAWAPVVLGRHPLAWRCEEPGEMEFPRVTELRPVVMGAAPAE